MHDINEKEFEGWKQLNLNLYRILANANQVSGLKNRLEIVWVTMYDIWDYDDVWAILYDVVY